MDEAANKINIFTTRVRQLILRKKELERENAELQSEIAILKEQEAQLKQQIEEAKAKTQQLRTARLLEVADGDIESARRRVAMLIRSVNKCITLLSEK